MKLLKKHSQEWLGVGRDLKDRLVPKKKKVHLELCTSQNIQYSMWGLKNPVTTCDLPISGINSYSNNTFTLSWTHKVLRDCFMTTELGVKSVQNTE